MVKSFDRVDNTIKTIRYLQADTLKSLECDLVWSTLPVPGLVRGMTPSAPSDLLEVVDQLEYRAMLLIYLVLEQDQFTEFDAHYFPEEPIKISRLSEPKNYSLFGPSGTTVICAELPCSVVDQVWEMTPDELGEVVKADLARASIPLRGPVKEVVVKRLRHAYPMYPEGYEIHFQKLDAYVSQFDNLLSFGRQGLFAHDNTHHALYMAYSAVKCLERDGRFDQVRWKSFRKEFENHVVED
jgi:protoporphyrinogen oxidase